jgi:hypothetical protein
MVTPMGIALGEDRRLFAVSLNTSSVHVFGLEGYSADSDDDGFSDAYDNCPDIYNPEQSDSDVDGIGDACDDCPSDPDKTDPGVCGCGVVDTDSDNDGTPDCNDGCPFDDNKTDAGTCGCNVLDTDLDGDGIIDCNDNCHGVSNPDQSDIDFDELGDACDEDADGDGFSFNNDCHDLDPNINPNSCDIKGDGVDQDCDGTDRTKGKPCNSEEDTVEDKVEVSEGKGKTCSDGIDNDGDGLYDCDDPDCSKNRTCK